MLSKHETEYDNLAHWLGIAALQKLVPFSQKSVDAALASGDKHLNTLNLYTWDKQHGIPNTSLGRCQHCKQLLPKKPQEDKNTVWDLVKEAMKRDHIKRFSWSLSDTVCVLKHVAKYYPQS